jgi:hypothetical protein
MSDLSLKTLQQRIAQQDTELHRLRQEFEGRQTELTSLQQRKQALLTELQQVERQLVAVAEGKSVLRKTPKNVPTKKLMTKPSVVSKAPSSGAQKAASLSLPALVIAVVREAGEPVTVQQLVGEVKKRGFQSKSADFAKMVQIRVYELVKKGLLKRAADQSGFVPAKANQLATKAGLPQKATAKTR